MCKYCDILKQNVKDNKDRLWIENRIFEDEERDRCFMLCKYSDKEYTIEYDSPTDSFSININFCPMCGRKLKENENN